MSANRNRSASESTTSAERVPFPFVGVTALIAGAIMPGWVLVATVTRGLDALAWVPVIMLFEVPVNLFFLALFIVAVVCGIGAVRKAGTDRVLGRIGLILAGVQLLVAAAAYLVLVWALTDGTFGL